MVKDDAKRLERCLKSAATSVDEIIVLDTGSKDNSINVAKESGAKVIELPWQDAYDVAINHVIDHVETEWILRLDSDEWLVPNQEKKIRELMDDQTAFAYLLVRIDQFPNDNVGEMTMIRMWRNDPLMRYVGTVHENFPHETLSQCARGRFVAETNFSFNHDGYLHGISQAKRERNWHLLHKELSIRPGNLYFEIHLADAYCDRNPKAGWDSVKKLAKRAAEDESDDCPLDAWALLFMRYFQMLPESDLFSELTDAIIIRTWRWFARFPNVMWAKSLVDLRRNNKWHAFQALLQLEHLSLTGEYSRWGHVDPAFLTFGLWQNLAQAAHQIGKIEVAKRNYLKLLEVNPGNRRIIEMLESLG